MDTKRWSSTVRRGCTALSVVALAGLSPALAHAEPSGPDVSSWQHVDGRMIDWHAVRAAGHQFAMVKATEGLHYVNPYFVPDSILMRTAGVARGTYHFARPELPPEPQAALYAATVLGQNGPLDLPPVLDLETSGGLAPADLINWTERYLATVRALTGRTAIIYTYPHFWKTAMADTSLFTHHPLWIADYSGNPEPDVPGNWPTWTFWQTTDRGSVPGIGGATDVNRFNATHTDFARFANMSGLFGSS
ncbi:glycoside hydrolase family 25 protein [Nocardia neocaledoniensis]|uniref:glycoside hydrolase family 25 protein n=1 Tax=Nocardia neocaledoniensis TaxID=236511 RepID=UPI002453A31C|nr:glycoside hydrolase family 25 protein [Nocardia neocaledoniensis]